MSYTIQRKRKPKANIISTIVLGSLLAAVAPHAMADWVVLTDSETTLKAGITAQAAEQLVSSENGGLINLNSSIKSPTKEDHIVAIPFKRENSFVNSDTRNAMRNLVTTLKAQKTVSIRIAALADPESAKTSVMKSSYGNRAWRIHAYLLARGIDKNIIELDFNDSTANTDPLACNVYIRQ
jgi:hypothetical protein